MMSWRPKSPILSKPYSLAISTNFSADFVFSDLSSRVLPPDPALRLRDSTLSSSSSVCCEEVEVEGVEMVAGAKLCKDGFCEEKVCGALPRLSRFPVCKREVLFTGVALL